MNCPAPFRYLPVAVLLAISLPAQAASVSFGTLAISGVLDCSSLPCSEISNIDGGSGIDPAISDFTETTGSGDVTLAEAIAVYDDAGAYTPSLGVYVDNLSGFYAGAVASASGIQAYSNTGIDPLSISLDIMLSIDDRQGFGSAVGGQVALFRTGAIEITGDPNDFSSVVINPGNPDLIQSVPVAAVGTTTLDFVVAPGEDFLIWASLSASALEGSLVDARNTLSFGLSVNGVENDISSLSIASENVGVIPLPAGVWLFLTGIGLVGSLTWRRKAAAVS